MISKLLAIFTLGCGFYFQASTAAECDVGWTPYNSDVCVKVFQTSLMNYSAAQAFCDSQASQSVQPRPSLPIVLTADYQNFLANLFFAEAFDDIWLGARFDEPTSSFIWSDGNILEYTNWADGYPRTINDSDRCMNIRPPNAKSPALWADASCQRSHVVACQRQPSMTLDEVITELIKLRKESFPIGFIYVEYPFNQPPNILWPTMTWRDVTNNYAGSFFRAQGGNAAAWGALQGACAPRITHVRFGGEAPDLNELPENGWSTGVKTDDWSSGWDHYIRGQSFHTAGCEVRPQNFAIRVWQRVA
ncbi:uncharacterized protein LOC110855683 [Folsomia candida]|nr:uncharacterized protein LOC110855683 [Folsomia candida]